MDRIRFAGTRKGLFRVPGSIAAVVAAVVVLAAPLGATARAEEIRLYNNDRVYGLIDGLGPTEAGNVLRVIEASGARRDISLEEVVSITYRGRERQMIQSGTQEFRFVGGGQLRARILGNQGDEVLLLTRTSGNIALDLNCFTGFVALPVMGLYGRKALEMVEQEADDTSPYLDVVMDRRGSVYPGVVRRVELTDVYVDHEHLLQVVPIKMLYVAGVRLAEATRRPEPPWTTGLRIRLYACDDSIIEGELVRIHLDVWYIRPLFNPETRLGVDLQEIRVAQVINARMQYLSQLRPIEVKESTLLAPPQPYRMDLSCQGDPLVIAGQHYPWGIGVHADSELTFRLGKRFKLFRSAIGIAHQVRTHGSVLFEVIGDGRVLYTSPVVKSGDPEPREIEVKIEGVDKLTLKVTAADDLDLGDVANWGSARLLR